MIRRALLTLAILAPSLATAAPVDDRTVAFEVLNRHAMTERVFSNCRWIRGVRDDAALARWRGDNKVVTDAAKAILDAQGGLTPRRKAVVEGLAALNMGEGGKTKDDCKAFLTEARTGAHDLTATVPMPVLQRVLAAKAPAGPEVTWVLEQRRQPTGVLAYFARRWTGEGSLSACEDEVGSAGHIHLRQRITRDLQPVADPDPELWLAECLDSPVDPVTGARPTDPS